MFFSNNTSGAANQIRLLSVLDGSSGVLVDGNGYVLNGMRPVFLPVSSGPQNTILFVSNEYNDSGTKHLYKATFGVADTPTALDQIPTGASGGGSRTVNEFAVSNQGDILFIADPAPITLTKFHTFLTDANSTSTTDVSPPLAGAQYVAGLQRGPNNYSVIQQVTQTSSVVESMFLTDISDTANLEHTQMTRIYDSDTLGRFRVSYVPYTRVGGAVNVEGIGANSGCHTMVDSPSSGSILDGEKILTNIFGPAGNVGGINPFVVAIDIFPLATNCNGSFERYLFPNGLANPGSTPHGADVNVIGVSATGTTIFVKD